MTDHVVRLYALAGSLLALFLAWAAIAAHPWQSASAARDPRLAALAAYEQRVRRDTVLTRRVVAQRWADYRAQLARRQKQLAAQRAAQAAAAAAPSVRIVTLPPLTTTRSS